MSKNQWELQYYYNQYYWSWFIVKKKEKDFNLANYCQKNR